MKTLCFTGFFTLKLVSSSYESVISLHVIAKSPIILANNFPFSQLHVAGFKI